MNIEIITIGDELLLGHTIDTNSAFIARQIAEFGFFVSRRVTMDDEIDEIVGAIREARARTGRVITTGGLGPTADDNTVEAVASAFGRSLDIDNEILEGLRQRWRRRFDVDMPESNRKQALVPGGATVLHNNHGSAPGFYVEDERRQWVIVLPGVPREMRGMMQDTVIPMLQGQVRENVNVVRSLTLRTANIAESALADRLGSLARSVEGLPLAFLPGVDGVDLRITSIGLPTSDADRKLRAAANAIRERVGSYVYGENDDDLAAIVLEKGRAREATISVAESCTGGLLGARITNISGSSATFMGGVIAYDNAVKQRDLGVSAQDLVQHGAVSEAVARAMSTGVRERFGTTVGIGITGIAGPGGGSPEKPVGTVWVAVDLNGDVHATSGVLPGDRQEIRARAAQLALDRLNRALNRDTSSPGWTARG